MKNYFIAGIGTGVGKTLAAAILTESLQADYWKPVQTGTDEDSDTATVRDLVSNTRTVFHPESYSFRLPLSPHAAAEAESSRIEAEKIIRPRTDNTLIIEGAGGLMVPLSEEFLLIDLIPRLEAEVILVSRHYLGSINHTLLSVDALRCRNIPVRGIIFNGVEIPATERVITKMTGLHVLGRIPEVDVIDRDFVKKCGEKLSWD